jgi:hypothetical protein
MRYDYPMKYTRTTFLTAALLLALVPSGVGAAANPNAEVDALVRAAFADAPEMIAVAKCESGLRQFNDDGTPLHGGGGGKYVGIFQISEAVHAATAARLGDDINAISGNIAYARHLYDEQGTVPWVSCLPKKPRVSAKPADAENAFKVPDGGPNWHLTVNLRSGITHPQVKILQLMLNHAGYVIASTGPGSKDNETTYFGAMTRTALRKFQCDKGIACDGDESATGYGNVGPKTRAALNAIFAL